MTDRLTELLQHTAGAWSQGPVPTAPDVRPRRARSWLAPALAAAACVVVALLAAGLSSRSGPAEPVTAGFATPITVDMAALPRGDDAGLHSQLPAPPAALCRMQDVRARFLDRTLLLTTTGYPCRLPNGVVPLGGAVRSTRTDQPDVPNPPTFRGEYLGLQGLVSTAAWSGTCPEPGTLRLAAPGWSGATVTVTGAPASCGGTADPELVLGPAHRVGTPGGVVPIDRAGLELALRPPTSAVAGGRISYVLTVRNPTSTPIALRPCPTFTQDVRTAKASGFGGLARRFPCERLPQSLAPGDAVGLALTAQLPAPEAGAGADRATLTLTIAGAKEATTAFALAPAVVTERVTIPYSPPLSGYTPPAVPRVQPRNGAAPIQISAPTSVRAGDVLRYRAVLTLPPDEGVSLAPCPGWGESFYPAPSTGAAKSAAGLRTRTGPVTCAKAPAALKEGSEVTFEMELTVPLSTEPGPYQVVWQLLDGLDSAPFDFTVTAR